MHRDVKKNTELHLLIFFLSLIAPLFLYFNRHVDDNRLVSWQWVFTHLSMGHLMLIVGAALILAWGASFISIKNYRPLFLFVISFVAASLFWGEPEVIVDASRYFTQAKQLKINGIEYFFREWGKDVFAWTDMPVVPFLYGLIFKLFGEQRVFIQLATTLCFAGTAVLTYQLGKTLWDEDVGFYGGLLLLGIPYLYTQIPLMLVDVVTMFFLVLSMVLVSHALTKGGLWWTVGAGLSLFFVFGAKYSTWLLLSVTPIIFVCFFFRDPLRTTRRAVVVALVAALLCGLFFVYFKEVMLEQINFLFVYQKPGLKSWGESYISTFLFQVHPFITGAVLFSALVAISKKDWKYLIISYLVLLLLFMQVKRIRYTLPVFPMLALLASYGLQDIQNPKLVRHLVFSIVATSFAIALFAYLPFLKTLGVANLQAAGKYLDGIAAEKVEVVTVVRDTPVLNPAISVPILDIYTEKKLVFRGRVASAQELEKAGKSPLRFTWDYPMPAYYLSEDGQGMQPGGLVIVADGPDFSQGPDLQKKIAGFSQSKTFQQTSDIFQHQTYVTIYHK
ncbi:MAG: glycosyltransferase family 39 protein [Proteobacteria bacterium]|nr:glycosyltransferase family 39 protein [Pseudomonadota bacterium]